MSSIAWFVLNLLDALTTERASTLEKKQVDPCQGFEKSVELLGNELDEKRIPQISYSIF